MAAKRTIEAGLRIDVDTLRGTRLGVPNLLDILEHYDIRATFFFSVGPDNMGRHLWRLVRPNFLVKMLRTKAASLYGWDILLKGTFWPGPLIGEKAAQSIRAAARAGHEIGFHAWDHYRWQARLKAMDRETITADMKCGLASLERIIGRPVDCGAAPGWRVTKDALLARDSFALRYLADCRGSSIFLPHHTGDTLRVPQIPTTLPTYDELIGRQGISDQNYNDHLLSFFRPQGLNVLTIHAETEGIALRDLFADFIIKSKARRIHFRPLGELLPSGNNLPVKTIVQGDIPGREGWVAMQAEGNHST